MIFGPPQHMINNKIILTVLAFVMNPAPRPGSGCGPRA